MKILNIRTIPGPNVYSHQPVLVMKLDLEDLAGRESYELPGFIDRLLQLLPGCYEHYCGLGRRGGFVERLRGGTYFGHIVEHVALELTDAVGISTNRGKTVEAEEPGCYLVTVTYKSEEGMKALLKTSVGLVRPWWTTDPIRWRLPYRPPATWWPGMSSARAQEQSSVRRKSGVFLGHARVAIVWCVWTWQILPVRPR